MTTPSQDGPAIELVGLTKRFGRTLAVNNLSLTIPRGSTFGLLGPNGAGKSTTIKMLMGMLSITAGEARVLGIDVAADPVQVKQRVGYVPETHHIYRWMRVREAIGFCKSCFRSWNDQTCREMLELFGLDPEKKVKHLSKGMQAKLALLLAVSHEPELLLLDEPLSGLDPIAREEFLDGVLRTICDRGQTVLISSHMLDDVRRLADTVGILYEGKLLLQGNLDALLTSTKRICATLRDGCRPEANARRHDLAARSRPRVDDHGPRFLAGEGPAGPGDRRRGARPRGRSGAGGTVQGLHSRTKGITMKWLFWKDYRHNRLIVFAALALLLGPHLIGLGVMAGHLDPDRRASNGQAVYWTAALDRKFCCGGEPLQSHHIAVEHCPDWRQRDFRRACRSLVGVPVLLADHADESSLPANFSWPWRLPP